jgi:membrane protein YqaA with SNARE-associated domain
MECYLDNPNPYILAISSILGGLITYYIGFSGNKFLNVLYKKPRKKHEDKTGALLERYGWLIIFFLHGYLSWEISYQRSLEQKNMI